METNDRSAGTLRNAAMRPRSSALSSAARSIFALLLREMSTRFGRTPGGYMWAVLQPLGMIIALGLAFSLIARTPSLGTSFLLFKASGLLPFNMFRLPAGQVGGALSFSKRLLLYPGVTWIDAIIARMLLNALLLMVVTILILTGIVIYDNVTLIIDWPPIFLAVFLAFNLAFGIGVLNCYLFGRFDAWSNIWGILTAPLMITSGVIFLIETLPPVAQNILWYNPLVHIIALMRTGIYSTYHPNYISVTYVLFVSLVPMVIGLLLVRKHHLYLLNR